MRNVKNSILEEPLIHLSRSEEHTQEEARLIIREKKMGATEDESLTIQRRSLSNEEYEELKS